VIDRVPLARFMPYGAPDLQVIARPNLARALVLASALMATAFTVLGVVLARHPDAVRTREIHIHDFLPPPPPMIEPRTEAASPAPTVRPSGSTIDRIVPDEQIHDLQPTFMSPSEVASGVLAETGTGPVILEPAKEEPLPDRATWVYTDQLPEVVRAVKPNYPELAKIAGIEGPVVVHMLVGKDGHVLKVELDPRVNVLMLNDAALEAARGFLFQPALANGHPVAVWVAQTFRFRLHE
jgi:protein TonB